MLFFYSESCYSHISFPLTHNLLQLHVFMLVQTTNAGSSTDRTGAQQCVSKSLHKHTWRQGTARPTTQTHRWCDPTSAVTHLDLTETLQNCPAGICWLCLTFLNRFHLHLSHTTSPPPLSHLTDILLKQPRLTASGYYIVFIFINL